MRQRSHRQSGFTLLEIIVTLIMASILGVILVEFVHTSAQQSVQPIYMIKQNMSLGAIIEKMNADYRKHLLQSTSPLVDLRTDIESGTYGEDSRLITWIRFDGSQTEIEDISGDNRIMKVEVTKAGRSATVLFTK